MYVNGVGNFSKWSVAAHVLHTFEIEVITSDKIPRSAMTKNSLVRQFEIFSMVSWAVASSGRVTGRFLGLSGAGMVRTVGIQNT